MSKSLHGVLPAVSKKFKYVCSCVDECMLFVFVGFMVAGLGRASKDCMLLDCSTLGN